ncbi:MAG TPA: hypothetical protein VMW52_06110 [Phycisphaerae bacterium]|nr:hypothetical protein [Phycisphaerae bacterium]
MLTADPDARFDLSLASDQKKPPETRPTFVCRPLSGRELKRLAGGYDDSDPEATGADAIVAVFERAATGLVGWRNVADPETGEALPFAAADLDRCLTMGEALELMGLVIAANSRPTGRDLGNSESPSPTGSGGSADPAPDPDGAAAPGDRPQ